MPNLPDQAFAGVFAKVAFLIREPYEGPEGRYYEQMIADRPEEIQRIAPEADIRDLEGMPLAMRELTDPREVGHAQGDINSRVARTTGLSTLLGGATGAGLGSLAGKSRRGKIIGAIIGGLLSAGGLGYAGHSIVSRPLSEKAVRSIEELEPFDESKYPYLSKGAADHAAQVILRQQFEKQALLGKGVMGLGKLLGKAKPGGFLSRAGKGFRTAARSGMKGSKVTGTRMGGLKAGWGALKQNPEALAMTAGAAGLGAGAAIL